MKKEVSKRMKLCENKQFQFDKPELASEIMNELIQIQEYIDAVPVESEKPTIQSSFNQINYLVKQLVLFLENGDKRVIM